MQKLCVLALFALLSIGCSKNNSVSDEVTITDDMPIGGGDDPIGLVPCENGMAGDFPCDDYDLLGRMPLTDMAAASANDIWGWTDPDTGKEYALLGLNNGTAFIDISDTENLLFLGKLPTATTDSPWRDIKVYQNHAFIGSEAGGHGMQVFDLKGLRNIASPPATFSATTHFTGFGNSHNIVINEETGFAYPVGTARDDDFNGGVHFVNVQDPANPVAAGGYGGNGYTHDAQVITYNGPDVDYTGSEILIGANESSVVVVDVTDKENPTNISTLQYNNIGYTHQGWFTEDQRFFILGDETDEINSGFNSRTLVFDMENLDDPVLFTTYFGSTSAIDHNGYVKGDEFFLANYSAGVRILDISGIANSTITEVGFFDTLPANNTPSFTGVWSVYPYFDSGKIVVSDIETGLFVIKKSD